MWKFGAPRQLLRVVSDKVCCVKPVSGSINWFWRCVALLWCVRFCLFFLIWFYFVVLCDFYTFLCNHIATFCHPIYNVLYYYLFIFWPTLKFTTICVKNKFLLFLLFLYVKYLLRVFVKSCTI